MSFRIQRSKAVSKRPGSYLPQPKIVFVPILVLVFACAAAAAQVVTPISSPSNPGADSREITSADQARVRNAQNAPAAPPQSSAKGHDTCLLPPLNQPRPSVSSVQLQTPAAASKEYQKACSDLKDKKIADAEKHLRKAVRDYPKYAAAWVTLGQVLATQQRTEARGACLQGSSVDPSYVPAYLCLADIAARAREWDEVLKLSKRGLELDPAHNAVAYEYHAAANLNLHNLAGAEESGLRAVAIDTDHREPRVHFVMAQIYEAKGDATNEAVQLREYLKYSGSADDIAMVEQYLSNLERRAASNGNVILSLRSRLDDPLRSSMGEVGPPDIDAVIPPVVSGTCPLTEILKKTSNRTLDLIQSLQHFSASERIEQSDIDKNGRRRNSTSQEINYVVQIERNSHGYPSVREYRSASTSPQQRSVMDSGTAAFALIFHPAHLENFAFRCEGLTELEGSAAWQVRFEESADPNKAFAAMNIGRSVYLPRFKGRAWITISSYDVMRIETDLVAPIQNINLQREHQIINYEPVEFLQRHVRLWLPESTSLYIAYRGHQYERVHRFSQFQLFLVDSAEAVKEPSPAKFRNSVANIFPAASGR